jgi:hypothetical protein
LDDEDDRSGDDELNDVPSEDEESGVNNGVGADNDGVGQAEETRVVTLARKFLANKLVSIFV